MLDALIHFGFFIGQTIIIIAAILIVFGGIIAIASKGKLKENGKITLRKLNKYFTDLKTELNSTILSKSEQKTIKKAQKSQAKAVKKQDKKTPSPVKNKCYVLNFTGDIRASHVSSLREEITAVLQIAKTTDEVLVKIESTGGTVHGYGLAASQLQRIKDANIPLTISVDKVAASGGYMMACVADKLIAAPFAIIGSIGVVAQIPNFHKLLKKHHIDFEQITAGEYKRTLTMFGENDSKGRKKMQADLEDVHILFKDFIKDHRPKIDIAQVSTGEHWFAKRAIELNLVDALQTSDDYLLKAANNVDIYEITYKKKKKFSEKLSNGVSATLQALGR
jgi:serine protease SohB